MRIPIEKISVPFFTLDPGVRGCGLAYFTPAGLWAAWYLEAPGIAHRGAAALAVADALRAQLSAYTWGAAVVEWPVQRAGQSAFANREDITELTGVAAACCMVFAERCPAWQVYTPLPEEWKGQTPKHVMQSRLVGAAVADLRLPRVKDFHSKAPGVLPAEEMARIVWTGNREKNHNTVDAVCLGIRYSGRGSG